MTDTPIIDIAYRAGCPWYTCEVPNCQPECENYKISALEILRAALPWEPSTETILAMAHAYSTDWDSANLDQRHWWELKSIDAYQAKPIMRELYPEKFE